MHLRPGLMRFFVYVSLKYWYKILFVFLGLYPRPPRLLPYAHSLSICLLWVCVVCVCFLLYVSVSSVSCARVFRVMFHLHDYRLQFRNKIYIPIEVHTTLFRKLYLLCVVFHTVCINIVYKFNVYPCHVVNSCVHSLDHTTRTYNQQNH